MCNEMIYLSVYICKLIAHKISCFGARSWFVKMKHVFLQSMILNSTTGLEL